MASKPSISQGQAQTNSEAYHFPLVRAVDLATLPIGQLNQIKNQLTQELQHLSTSFQQLKIAQGKFRDCIVSLREGLGRGEGTPILVPLTSSLYVSGKLASADTVLVDVGTGFYVEKTQLAAQGFYKRKVEELGKNLMDLEKIVQGKQGNLGAVEDCEWDT
ncbi:MAG: hypothetical protein Q9163_003259 [Psora crenata]